MWRAPTCPAGTRVCRVGSQIQHCERRKRIYHRVSMNARRNMLTSVVEIDGAEECVRLKKRSVASCYTAAASQYWNCQSSFRAGWSCSSVCCLSKSILRDMPCSATAVCKRHFAEWKPRVCSACMHTVPPYTATILSPGVWIWIHKRALVRSCSPRD